MLAVYLAIKQRDKARITRDLTVAQLATHGKKADVEKFLASLEGK